MSKLGLEMCIKFTPRTLKYLCKPSLKGFCQTNTFANVLNPLVAALTFLGLTLEYVKDTLSMHQHAYILTKLDDRNRLHGQGKACLPTPTEGKALSRKR